MTEKTKLGNMVVKEFLESKGVQLSRFHQFRKEKPAARRKLLRMQGGEISVPIPRTNNEIRETLMVSILCSKLNKLTLKGKFSNFAFSGYLDYIIVQNTPKQYLTHSFVFSLFF